MKYIVRYTVPALTEVCVTVEAQNQQDAIIAGYDSALAATPQSVKVLSLNAQSATFDSCEPVVEPAPANETLDAPPPSPYAAAAYLVKRFCTPESFADGKPDFIISEADYCFAKNTCKMASESLGDYLCRVNDKLGNKLYEIKSELGRYVVVAYSDDAQYVKRSHTVWKGWISSKSEAKKLALELLEKGKVFAVGVLDANAIDKSPSIVMTLIRSSK